MDSDTKTRRTMEAITSFIVPGFGQLLQERLGRAILLFVASLLAWPLIGWFGGGVLVHLYSAYDAATWKGEL